MTIRARVLGGKHSPERTVVIERLTVPFGEYQERWELDTEFTWYEFQQLLRDVQSARSDRSGSSPKPSTED